MDTNWITGYFLITSIAAAIDAYVRAVKNERTFFRFTNYQTFAQRIAKNTMWAAAWGWYTVPVAVFALPGYIVTKYLWSRNPHTMYAGGGCCPYGKRVGLNAKFSFPGTTNGAPLTVEESEKLSTDLLVVLKSALDNKEFVQKMMNLTSSETIDKLARAGTDTAFLSKLSTEAMKMGLDALTAARGDTTTPTTTATATTNPATPDIPVTTTVTADKPVELAAPETPQPKV